MTPYKNKVLVRELKEEQSIALPDNAKEYKTYVVEKIGDGIEGIKKGQRLFAKNYQGFLDKKYEGLFIVNEEDIISYE